MSYSAIVGDASSQRAPKLTSLLFLPSSRSTSPAKTGKALARRGANGKGSGDGEVSLVSRRLLPLPPSSKPRVF